MRIHDSLFGLVFVALGGAVLFTVSGYPKMPGQDVGPNMFPGIAGALIAIFGLVLALRGALRPAGGTARGRALVALGPWRGSPRHMLAFLSIILGVIAYIAMANIIGFLILMPVLLVVWHIAFGVRPCPALASALIATALAWSLFYKLLGVPLPWGLLKNHAF